MGVVFDKLGFMRKLEGDGGFTRPQAERLTEAFYDAVVESVATKQDVGDLKSELKQDISGVKQDISDVRTELKQEISDLRTELKQEISDVRTELKQEVRDVRAELTAFRSEVKAEIAQLKVWAVGVAAAGVSVLSALKFFS